MTKVLICRTIYEKLASAFTEEQAVLYNQRVEEISPNLRYCAYNIGESWSYSCPNTHPHTFPKHNFIVSGSCFLREILA